MPVPSPPYAATACHGEWLRPRRNNGRQRGHQSGLGDGTQSLVIQQMAQSVCEGATPVGGCPALGPGESPGHVTGCRTDSIIFCRPLADTRSVGQRSPRRRAEVEGVGHSPQGGPYRPPTHPDQPHEDQLQYSLGVSLAQVRRQVPGTETANRPEPYLVGG